MNKSNEKGVSLIILTIAIILIVIITSILVYNAKTGVKLEKLNKMYNDIQVLSDKISTYYSNYGAIPASIKYDNSSIVDTIKKSGQLSPNDNDNYYIRDLGAIENLSLNYGLDYKDVTELNASIKSDIYIINEQSHHIYYVKGIELDDKIYYTNDVDDKIDLWSESNTP